MDLRDWGTIVAMVTGITSLGFSFYTHYANRKKIFVTWDDNLEVIKKDLILIGGQHLDRTPCWFRLCLSVVNPSSHDIGFFDLRAFNPENNMNLEIATKKAMPVGMENSQIVMLFGNDRYTKMDIPDRNFGIFPANSLTKFDLLFLCLRRC